MDYDASSLPHMQCPALDHSRYSYWQHGARERTTSEVSLKSRSSRIDFFFALNLRDCLPLLPRLLGSIVEVISFLGSHRYALSIVEGNSADGTGEVLAALRQSMKTLGVPYYFSTSDINPQEGDHIALAALRNLALLPLVNSPEAGLSRYTGANTNVASSTNVAICPEAILELLHQRRMLRADMVCAMDWTNGPDTPTFYTVWIARGISVDPFFRVSADPVSWEYAHDIFWNDHDTREQYMLHKPFQVFTCWNGAVAFTAAPFIEGNIRFRAARAGECRQGEPQLFCKDLWLNGWGRIAVVPSISLEYNDEKGRWIK
jgi:alpha-1,3-mannosyltransferase